jgi:EAL domain-containing protein (putative c-di-GMP-specific phosphodiesterase class I)
VAEQNGLIVTIDYWMLSSACRQIKSWETDPIKCQWVLSVNVSAKELGQPDYVETVKEILAGTGANPQRLKLELTESTLASDMQGVVAKMHQLKALGVRFALDDFGTGFSSLSYLQQMPIDQLKIDQSFVRDLGVKGSDTSIVRTVIALGQSLGLSVIAEGVETAAQRDLLAQLGCHHYQGYFYGKPAPLETFVQGLA